MIGYCRKCVRLGCACPPRKLVYMAHPLRGATVEETQANRYAASQLVAEHVRAAEDRGDPIAPVCAWIHLAEVWSEADGRELGLVIDCALIEVCAELWLLGPARELSPGMRIEFDHALEHKVIIRDYRK